MRVDANNITELIDRSGDQQPNMIFLDEFLQQVASELKRQFFSGPSITMIGFGEMPWQGKAKSGVWPLICLAPQKGSTNLYIAGDKDEQPLLEYYNGKLGNVSMGKHCLRVKKIENLNLPELENLVKDSIQWMQTQENKYGRDCARPGET